MIFVFFWHFSQALLMNIHMICFQEKITNISVLFRALFVAINMHKFLSHYCFLCWNFQNVFNMMKIYTAYPASVWMLKNWPNAREFKLSLCLLNLSWIILPVQIKCNKYSQLATCISFCPGFLTYLTGHSKLWLRGGIWPADYKTRQPIQCHFLSLWHKWTVKI